GLAREDGALEEHQPGGGRHADRARMRRVVSEPLAHALHEDVIRDGTVVAADRPAEPGERAARPVCDVARRRVERIAAPAPEPHDLVADEGAPPPTALRIEKIGTDGTDGTDDCAADECALRRHARSLSPSTPAVCAQLAQQNTRPAASTP